MAKQGGTPDGYAGTELRQGAIETEKRRPVNNSGRTRTLGQMSAEPCFRNGDETRRLMRASFAWRTAFATRCPIGMARNQTFKEVARVGAKRTRAVTTFLHDQGRNVQGTD